MPAPIVPILALAGIAALALSGSKPKPVAPGEPGTPPPPPAPPGTPEAPTGEQPPVPSGPPTPRQMPEALRDKLAAAISLLTIDPATKQIIGPVTAAAVQVATATAAELEAAGFVSEAAELRGYAKIAAGMVPSPPPAATVQVPGIPPELQEQLNRALQMERDPARLRALRDALKQLQPQGPEVTAAVGMLDALILQIETAAQTQTSLEQIQDQIDQGAPAVQTPPFVPPAVSPISDPAMSPGLAGTHQTIRLGSKGPDVVAWQTFLGLKADGIFGSATQAATIAFQKSRGLTPDGVVGPKTWEAAQNGGSPPFSTGLIVKAPAVIPPGGTLVSSAGTLEGPHATIRLGSKGPDVAVWQRFLGITADSIFGSGTHAATVQFQKSRSLTADGVVGPATWAAAQSGAGVSKIPPVSISLPGVAAISVPGLPGKHATIRLGSKGPDVVTWQTFLGLKADGVFGPATASATIVFQKSRGLTADGVVGPATWAASQNALPGSTVIVTPVGSQTPVALPIAAPGATPGSLAGAHATIRNGSKGPDVVLWQNFLKIKSDGVFGPATVSATIAFQKAKGLKADGVVGPATWAAALGTPPLKPGVPIIPVASQTPVKSVPATTFEPGSLAGSHQTIRSGSRGTDVATWQKFLKLTPDGVFGPATHAATVAFQKSRKLSADGVVGPATWAAAQGAGSTSAPAALVKPSVQPKAPVAAPVVMTPSVQPKASAVPGLDGPHATIRSGSKGKDVTIWQTFLQLKADGIFGSGTKAATIAFQKSQKLTADGVVGPKTWEAAQRVQRTAVVSGSASTPYTIQPGDTGEKVAFAFTGNKDRWPELVHANPNIADPVHGLRLVPGSQIALPSSWPSAPTGSAPPPPLATSVPAPSAPVMSVDSPPVPQPLPPAKTPLEIAASAVARNLRAVQQKHGVPGAKGQEDRSLVARLQKLAGMTNPDGLAGPGTILTIARCGECALPLVMYWPKGASANDVMVYRGALQKLAQKALSTGHTETAAELEKSAAREGGQSSVSGRLL